MPYLGAIIEASLILAAIPCVLARVHGKRWTAEHQARVLAAQQRAANRYQPRHYSPRYAARA